MRLVSRPNNSTNQRNNQTKQTDRSLLGISDCPDAYARWFCLNGATCFTLNKANTTMYNCWCTRGFHGLRCDHKYVLTDSNQDIGMNQNSNTSHLTNNSSIRVQIDSVDDQINYKEFGISIINPGTEMSQFESLASLRRIKTTDVRSTQYQSRALMLNNFFVIFSSILILFLLIR